MADTSQQVKEWGRYAVPPGRDVGAALAALSEEDLPAPRSTSGIATRAIREGRTGGTALPRTAERADDPARL